MSFPDLGISPELVIALDGMRIVAPSPVQRMAIPALVGGASIVAVARTGSGKTLAYALPLLQRIHAVEAAEGAVTVPGRPRGLVLTGTRELVEQTLRVCKTIGHRPPVRVRAVAGGMLERHQRLALTSAVDVLIANPPRLATLLREGRVQLDDLRVVIVDEADTLLAAGQRGDVVQILDRVPAGVPVSWFSATLPESIRLWLLARPERPALLLSKDAHSAPESVTVRNIKVKWDERADAAHTVLVGLPDSARGIVFCNRRETADAAGAALRERGEDVRIVHGGLLPRERQAALKAFAGGEGRVLVTTELAGRGLHLEGLAFVLNWELPERASDYMHRIGRVGRMGAKGEVFNLVAHHDTPLLVEAERLARGGKLDTGESPRSQRDRKVQAANKAAKRERRPRAEFATKAKRPLKTRK